MTRPAPGRRDIRILVGQVADQDNNNAQCLNAKNLLSRFERPGISWFISHYDRPDQLLILRDNIHLARLWRRSLWMLSKVLFYQRSADAIFYPGIYWFDDLGLLLRRWLGRKVPIIATLEGFVGDEERDRQLSAWVGHSVYCQRVSAQLLRRVDRLLLAADHIIAISPFIADMGRRLYGDKFSILPLGVDLGLFFPPVEKTTGRFAVIGAGRLYENKRPYLFVEMAKRFPLISFIWYGDGELRQPLQKDIAALGLRNIEFRGTISNRLLGEEFRKTDLFVLPSRSEGAPKVTQEASACGLPVICFGSYETPHVVDGVNGFVVWNDEQLFSRIEQLLNDPVLTECLGTRGAEMARMWDWDIVAPQWLEVVKTVLNS